MFLNYNLDIQEESKWLVLSPHSTAYDLPFYVTEAGHFLANKNFFTERSKKDQHYILYTISGNGYLKYRNEEHFLEKGTAIMINCNDYHLYRTESTEVWNHKWIHFNGSSCQAYMNLINNDGYEPVRIENNLEFERTIDEILKSNKESNIKQSIYQSEKVSELISAMALAKINNSSLVRKKNGHHHDDVQKAIEFISENFAEPITLEDLIHVVHLSKYYFLKLFHMDTGMTPYEYLINYRINQARRLLESTDLSILEIGLNVGFADESNFIKQFKKITNMTPLNYRKDSL